MERIIKVKDREIIYKIRRNKRAKKIRLSINYGTNIVITLPNKIKEKQAEKILKEKSDWILEKIDLFKKYKNSKLLSQDREDYIKNKTKALKFVNNVIAKYNKNNNFSYNKISIRNQKTRWGSCSRNKNININYKIIYLPEKIAEYIIIHELCHLKEFNHSQNFWNHVSQFIPNYLEFRKKLKNKNIFMVN